MRIKIQIKLILVIHQKVLASPFYFLRYPTVFNGFPSALIRQMASLAAAVLVEVTFIPPGRHQRGFIQTFPPFSFPQTNRYRGLVL